MSISTTSFLPSSVASVWLFSLTSSMSDRSIGGKGFLQYWKVLYCQNSSLCWSSAAPQSSRGGPVRPAPSSPPPLGGWASRGSSPGPRGPPGSCDSGGSPVSRPRPSRSPPLGALLSPLSRRLLGEAEGSDMAPASILRFRDSPGCEVPDGGIQSGGGGSSVKSQSRSRFQGTWNVSGSAARRLAMGLRARAETAGRGTERR